MLIFNVLFICDSVIHELCLVAQSCLTLCDPMECSPPGSSVRGDSPGKNTGVDCHALLSFWSAWDQISFVSHFSCVRFCATLWTARLLCPWDSPGTNTGVGCHSLLQGIFPTQDEICVSYVSRIGRDVLYH